MLDVQTANEEQPEEGTCVIISWILSQGATLGLKKKISLLLLLPPNEFIVTWSPKTQG